MPRILVLDNLSEEGVEIFRQADGFEVDVRPAQKPEQLAAIIGEYDGLVVRSATQVTADVIDKAGRLKVIGRAGVGVDNIDLDAATKKGIVVMNTPGGNTISACEHTFALLFALLRHIPPAHASMMAGRWDRKQFQGTEVRGKTLGIIGVGRIGGEVAKRAHALEMQVIAYDPILTKLKADALGVELVELDELLRRSDIITIHAPKTDKTVNMIDRETIKKMKPGVRIINTARGGIINEGDLAEALRNGVVTGAALDVYASEPPKENPFLGLENVVLTPHLAASTDEAQLTVAIDIANQMVDYLTTGVIVNAANVPSLDSETRKKVQPMLHLARRLGRFQSLFVEGRPMSVELEYAGEIGVGDTYPITASALQGFLEPLVETVNSVNAPILLEEHGIKYSETRTPQPTDYAFSISLTVVTDREQHKVSGTLFGPNKDPRICLIDHTRVVVRPEGCILVCFNEDKPLVIGRVASAIGEAGVNIADMTLGRDERGGKAAFVLNLDQPPTQSTLEKIRHVPHVIQARLVLMDQ